MDEPAADPLARHVIFDPALNAFATVEDETLDRFTERHRFFLSRPPDFQAVDGSPETEILRTGSKSVLVQLQSGLPGRFVLRLARRLVDRGLRVYFHWPLEGAVEVVDRIRLKSYWRHWVLYQVFKRLSSTGGAAPREEEETELHLHNLEDLSQNLKQSLAIYERRGTEAKALRKRILSHSDEGDVLGAARCVLDYVRTLDKSEQILGKMIVMLRSAESLLASIGDTGNRRSSSSSDAASVLSENGAILAEHWRGISDVMAENRVGLQEAAQILAHHAGSSPFAASLETANTNLASLRRIISSLNNHFDDVAEGGIDFLGALTKVEELLTDEAEDAAVSTALLKGGQTAPLIVRTKLAAAENAIDPIGFSGLTPSAGRPLPGTGVYLRTDYWAPILSGGSYGHTCYHAKALAETVESFCAVLANHFPLLGELGVRQVVACPEGAASTERDLLAANDFYLTALRPLIAYLRPPFLYERLCLGNFAGAKLSQEFSIPYFVEYNGSEISMKRSFDDAPYEFEDTFLAIEQVAFSQAAAISVISEPVKEDLVKRGVDESKILVNWNAVDLSAYRRPEPEARRAIRQELGFAEGDRVICFTGTFGGWHGIDVLAEAVPRIAALNGDARFLFIGEGHHKPLLRDAIASAGLQDRVHDAGRVPQTEGARLMGAADIFVSPHSSHMVDSRFFGSPTKIFEYMAYGAGIVASDLEQIGEILSPALRPGDLTGDGPAVGDERAVLCSPGDVDEFVGAVTGLAANAPLCEALGANARQAAAEAFTWDIHVERFWDFVGQRAALLKLSA